MDIKDKCRMKREIYEFVKMMKHEIGPVYGVAVNQEFGVLENFILHGGNLA